MSAAWYCGTRTTFAIPSSNAASSSRPRVRVEPAVLGSPLGRNIVSLLPDRPGSRSSVIVVPLHDLDQVARLDAPVEAGRERLPVRTEAGLTSTRQERRGADALADGAPAAHVALELVDEPGAEGCSA